MWAPYILFVIPYLSISFFFLLLDIQTSYSKYRTYQCSVDKLKKQYWAILPLVIFNLFFIKPILVYWSTKYVNIYSNNFDASEIILELVFFFLVYDVTFWISHRILHSKS